jgi:hypothetical protein
MPIEPYKQDAGGFMMPPGSALASPVSRGEYGSCFEPTGFTDFQPYHEVPTLLLYFSSSGEIVYEISIKYPGH